MMRPVIVIPAFDRPDALVRLLTSINGAVMPSDVTLYISLDGGASDDVARVANDFQFLHGSKMVVTRPSNLGLRAHILVCGDYALEHGAVIVLEDDLFVAPGFYQYAVQALENASQTTDVAGIALYSPRFNETAGLPFEPLNGNSDEYYMQLPCSWGQAWTATQWRGFREWLGSKNGERRTVEADVRVPENIRAWPETSWKKQFASYLVQKDKYFSYPTMSFSTNFSDEGVNVRRATTHLQVPLDLRVSGFHIGGFSADSLKYDAFHESAPGNLASLGVCGPAAGAAMDVHATKPLDLLADYGLVLTSRAVEKSVARYGLRLRPPELNCLVPDPEGILKLCAPSDVRADGLTDKLARQFVFKEYYAGFPLVTKRLAAEALASIVLRRDP